MYLGSAGRKNRAVNRQTEQEYIDAVRDLLAHEKVQMMRQFPQHGDLSCLEHSLHVSYNAFLVCKRLGLDSRSAARGGLLHDLFLYDWHKPRPIKGLHGFDHPKIALENALRYFTLSPLEREIIERHMWPLTLIPPLHRESLAVCLADKYCAFIEWAKISRMRRIRRMWKLLAE